MSRYFALSLVFAMVFCPIVASAGDVTTSVGNNANDDLYNKVISGNGTHVDFINYANVFIAENKNDVALNLYKEQAPMLNKLNRVNLGTLMFLNKDIKGGLQAYLNYLENNAESQSKENQVIRNNLIILFNQKSGASGKSKNESKKKSGKDSEGQGKGSPAPGKNKRQSKMKGMSNEDILSKIKSDDMVSQGEYIKKKIKNKNKNEVRW